MKRLQECFLLLLTLCFTCGVVQLARHGVFGSPHSAIETAVPKYNISRSDIDAVTKSLSPKPVDSRYPDLYRRFVKAHNRFGQSVGWALRPGNKNFHAFLWEGDHEVDLGTLGGSSSFAQSINDAGEIVGSSEIMSGMRHAFLWHSGHMSDLGTLGGNASFAFDINNRGQIVGDADTGKEVTHAFLYQNGHMIDLGTLGGMQSAARGIKNAGQIVGYTEMSISIMHAFLWVDGQMTDLNRRLPDNSGWELLEAQKITEDGNIIGEGEHGFEHLTFLLTPR